MTQKTVAFVVYPGISLLELVANRTLLGSILGRGPLMKWQAGYDAVVVGERVEAIPTDTPMPIIPQKTFADVPQPDGLVVIGGGADTLPALEHAELMEFVRRAGESATWVAATSTGALLLAAAGLLKGRLATTHWAYADRLEAYGAHSQPAASPNWVTDGKFTTAAGVSGAIDMAIGLGAKMTNQATAQFAQLMIEYDPHPPLGRLDWTTFRAGPGYPCGADGPKHGHAESSPRYRLRHLPRPDGLRPGRPVAGVLRLTSDCAPIPTPGGCRAGWPDHHRYWDPRGSKRHLC